jgi:hypothetical protein
LFPSEVLHGSPEFEPKTIVPAALACVVAYSKFGLIVGWQPLFGRLHLRFGGPTEVLGYAPIPVMVVVAMLDNHSPYRRTSAFPHLRRTAVTLSGHTATSVRRQAAARPGPNSSCERRS